MNPLRWVLDLIGKPRQLKEEFQRKISEAHLQIKTGEVSTDALEQASITLKSIKNKKLKLI